MLKLLRILLVTSLTAFGAFIVLPLPFVVWGHVALPGASEIASWKGLSAGLFHPSAQLLGVWLAGCWLGTRAGVFSMVLYLALGAFGLPVFIDGGGIDYGQHGAVIPLLAFPAAAWIIARIRGLGSARRTFWGLLSATTMISLGAVLNRMAGTGNWTDGRQWLSFAIPQSQALFGWLAMMVLFSALASLATRVHRAWYPPAPPTMPAIETEEDAEELPPLALPSGRPRDQRALPPSLAPDAKQLPAPPHPRHPDR